MGSTIGSWYELRPHVCIVICQLGLALSKEVEELRSLLGSLPLETRQLLIHAPANGLICNLCRVLLGLSFFSLTLILCNAVLLDAADQKSTSHAALL